MGYEFKYDSVARASGLTMKESATLTGDNQIAASQTELAAAKIGSLTTRTDNDTGVATMDAGHGFATSDKLDVYWINSTTGAVNSRRGMTATVSVNAVTIDGGTGDNLPTTSTALTVMKQAVEDFVVTAANLQGLVIYASKPGTIIIRDDEDAEIVAKRLFGVKGGVYIWDPLKGDSNPLGSTDSVSVTFTHNYSGGTAILRVLALVN